MFKKSILFFALFIFTFASLSTGNAHAYLLKTLNSLTVIGYQAGALMNAKKSNLSIKQSYTACKAIILDKYNPAVAKRLNSNEQKKLLNVFAPAEVTYCFMGYLKTKLANIDKTTNIAFLMGKSAYKHSPNLSPKKSYVACQNEVVRIDALLLKKQNTNIYKQFLYYVHPAQDTYCWVGYLDAAGKIIKVTKK